MKKSSKGIVAAGAGVVLLLGGGGTLAFWTETPSMPGGELNAGHMNLVPIGPDGGCDPWLLDKDEPIPPLVYNDGDPIVPGDVLTRSCSYTIEAVGNHLRAGVTVTDPVFVDDDHANNNFNGMLSMDVSDVVIGGVTKSVFTEEDNGKVLEATITVTFNENADNFTEKLDTVLESALITATQDHD